MITILIYELASGHSLSVTVGVYSPGFSKILPGWKDKHLGSNQGKIGMVSVKM